MDHTKELRTVSFCAGYGGIERGIKLTGQACRVVAYSEIEAYAVANLVAKMEAGELGPAPVWTNLKTFPMEQFSGKVDLLTGGFPCQPFSAAGARGADADPRHLFPEFKRFAEVVKPRFVFLENVDGIASAKLSGNGWADESGTPVLLHVCRELERVGYRVAAGCFSAREVGAPHKRRRWFILGELADTNDSNRGTKQECEYKEPPKELCGGDELAYTGIEKPNGIPQPIGRIKGSEIGEFGTKLDNTLNQGLQGHGGNEHTEGWQATGEARPTTEAGFSPRWPAPPGPYQYDWEEPRTVAYSPDSGRGRREDYTNGSHSGGVQEPAQNIKPMVRGETAGCGGDDGGEGMAYTGHERQESSREQTRGTQQPSGQNTGRQGQPYPIKSELGRAADGTSGGVDPIANRVDRLRLCGNGVVPQTAAVAWVTLRNQLNERV